MFEYQRRVSYSEIGPDMRMTLTSAIARMQDCSVFHSLSVDRGPEVWLKEQKSWMITSWQVRLFKMPELGRMVTTKTWPYKFQSFRGWRNFAIYDEDGALCADCNSSWAYFDMKLGKPCMVSKEESEAFGLDPKLEFEYAPRRIDLPDTGVRYEEPFKVSMLDIDTNYHVNNLRYIDMARVYVPADVRIRELRVQYIRQCKLGDEICPKIAENDEAYFISLDNCAGEPCAIVEFMIQ